MLGDTLEYSNSFLVLEKLISRTNISASGLQSGDTVSIATIKIISDNGSTISAQPILIKRQGQSYAVPDTIEANQLIFQLNKIDGGTIELGLKDYGPEIEFVTLKVYKFPFINLIWFGTAIMVCGFLISMSHRLRDNKTGRIANINFRKRISHDLNLIPQKN